MRNTIKCVITGKERITNKSYLKKRCDAVGVSEEEFRKYYVTRQTATDLRRRIKTENVSDIAYELNLKEESTEWTGPDVHKMVIQNGAR